FDFDYRAFELLAAFEQRRDENRINNPGLLLSAGGARLLLDFPVQPLRIAAQPRRQAFEPGEKAAPFVEFPAMLAKTVVQHTHSAAPATRPSGAAGRWRPVPDLAPRR